jgi:iron complex outermembrane receptor protein
MKSYPAIACGALLFATTALSTPCFAQATTPATPPAGQSQATGLEEVVIVARRTEERLQDVPISVTAVTPTALKEVSVDGGKDLIKLVPSLFLRQNENGSDQQYALRGIATGVVTYFAEVPTNSIEVEDQLWDLSSVQALSGPQGTLFGRNATGGAVLFVPQKPTDKFEGFVEGRYGNYNETGLTAVLNLPVNDMLQIRLGGKFQRRDGVVKNGLGPDLQSQNRDMARASILFTPTSWLTNYTVIDYSNRAEQPNANISTNFTSTAGCLSGSICLYGPLVGQLVADQERMGVRALNSSYPSYLNDHRTGVSNVLTASPGYGLTVKYIFGYRNGEESQFRNSISLNIPLLIGYTSSWSKEFDNEIQVIANLFDGRLKWTTGGFMSDNTATGVSIFQLLAPLNSTPIFNPALGNNDTVDSTTRSRAVYSQATFKVTDKLNLTGGIRYTQDDLSQVENNRGLEFGFTGPQICMLPASPTTDLANCLRSLAGGYNALTYNVSLDYRVNPGLLVYVNSGSGFNAGGFNGAVLPTNDPQYPGPTFGPEHLNDYEVGAKADWHLGGMPVRTNLSVYLSKYNNIQRTDIGSAPNGTPYQATANAERATVYGLQFESAWRLTPEFTLTANYGYLHAQYDVGSPIFPVNSLFSDAPEHTLNLAGTYSYKMALGGLLVTTVDYTYQSSTTTTDQNATSDIAVQPAFGLLGARMTWQNVAGSALDFSLYGKNLTDVTYFTFRNDLRPTFGFAVSIYNDPRTFGAELRYKF